MRTRSAGRFLFLLAAAAAALDAGAASAQPLSKPAPPPEPPVVAARVSDTSADTATVCLLMGRKLAADAAAHVADFVAAEPASQLSVQPKEDQLCVSGLAYATKYTLRVRPGLPFADGGARRAAAEADVDVPDRDPMLAVGGRGWILPRQNATGLTVQTVNVPTVRVRVLRVSTPVLSGSLARGETAPRPDPAQSSFGGYELQSLARSQGTVIWAGTMRTAPVRNALAETAFPLAGIVDPAKPGAYVVIAEDADSPPLDLFPKEDAQYGPDFWSRRIAGRWVISSDLGLSSVKGLDGLRATVRSLASAAPASGVKVQLLSTGQEVLAEATTGGDGSVAFPAPALHGKHAAAPAVLLATSADGDLAVQDLSGPAFDLSDRGAEGREAPGPIQAYVYTDRGIYRPGEAVHAVALLRRDGLTAVDGAGLTLVLRRPDGVEAQRATFPPQPDAAFARDMTLTATSAQGAWTVEAFVDPTLPPVGRATLAVQDFVPQQLKVTLTAPDGPATAQTGLKAELAGRFLYGAPAAGLHAEGEVRLERDESPVADAKGYSFGLADETIADPVQALELDDADDQGRVRIDSALKVPDGLTEPLRAVLTAGLSEPGGRVVNDTAAVKVRSGRALIGVRKQFGDRVNEGSEAGFDVRAFGPDGAPAAMAGLAWTLVREEPHWDWWRDGDAPWTFHFHTIDVKVADGALNVAADAPATLSRKADWGTYRLTVQDPRSGAATSVRFTAGWGDATAAADVPDRLDVTADRPALAPGQTAKVHLQGPFAGPAQVLIESAGRVLETRAIDLPAGGTTIDVTASEGWGAGVHVLASAYRPLSAPARAHDPVRAIGLAWIGTDPSQRTLTVTLGAPAKTEPRRAVSVPIHVAGARGPAFVTLAAVDEGILQLTRFASPDPVAALFGRTKLGLDLRDEYGRLLEGQAQVGALHEGGDDGSLGGAGLPATSRRTVALFHGPVALSGSGDATVELDVPDFAGELRLMAVAFDGRAAGRAEAPLTVRDPVVADVSLPRFLAPGDVAEARVSLDDADGPGGPYHLALSADGAAQIQGAAGFDVTLEPGKRTERSVRLAGRGAGVSHVQALLTGPDGLRIERGWDIAVRSPHPDLVTSETAAQAPGETYAVDPALLQAFVPGSAQVTVGYAAAAGIDVPGLLQSLYTYPYGCTEQLASSAYPLLYFDDARLLGKRPGDPAVKERVQKAIDTIVDRQDSSGRFGLWRVGDGEASVWLNVYALDFLMHARQAGFAAPERATDLSAGWVRFALASGMSDDGSVHREAPQPTRAYADYVLARTDRVDPAQLRLLSRDLEWSLAGGAPVARSVAWRGDAGPAQALSLAHLAGAQALMGDKDGAAQTFRLALANLDLDTAPDWWRWYYYWSPTRDLAGALAVAAETGSDDATARLLERLHRARLSPERMNTQEKAWLLAAAHALAARGGQPSLSVDGRPPQPTKLPFAFAPTADEIANGASVRNADSAAVFRTVTVRGSPVSAPPAVASGYRLRRETLSLSGEKLDDAKLRQTDRFLVVISGSVDRDVFRRTVVADMLPAGLEIESAVASEKTFPFLGQLTRLRAHEQRDDRYVAAFDVGKNPAEFFQEVDDDVKKPLKENEFRVAYVARAVTPGKFVKPETVVEDMYQPEVTARTAAGRTEVAPR